MSSQQRPGGGLAAASVSSGRAVLGAAKHKNWRANYLRALNIYTPDVDLARARVVVDPRQRGRPAGAVGGANAAAAGGRRGLVRTADEPARRSAASEKSSSSSGNRSAVSRLLGRRSTTSSSNNNNSHASPSPPDEHKGSYVFGMRSHLFRARRPATRGDVLVVDRVSAPIEIPTAQTPTQHTPIASERRDSRAKTPIAMADADSQARSNRQQQLLSWEEPSVMLGGSNGWPLEIDKPGRRPDKSLQFDSSDLPFVVGRRPPTYPTQHSSHRDGSEYSRRFDGTALGRHCRVGIPEEECDETEDDETEDLDRADDSRDDQEDESEEEDDIFKMDELEDSTRPKLKKKSSFRAFGDGENRTSYSSLGAGRRRGSLPAPASTMRGNQDDTDEYRTLSESFVPPHQMVERDCFSLGLRDELKRRPLRT